MKALPFVLLLLFTFPLHAKNIVFWLSIDGFKPQYLKHADTPNIDKLLSQGVSSRLLTPVFPSITFPSHVSQATGVKVAEHGISLNTFYDRKMDNIFSYPNEAYLLEAEPIWETAKRQGLRVAVLNWPLSMKQTSKFKSDYFNPSYEKELSDDERVERALKVWENDFKQGQVLDLVMAYVVGPDAVGHKYGPEDERVYQSVEATDKLIGRIMDKIKAFSSKPWGKEHKFYFLITTDHGMTKVENAVNLKLISGLEESKARFLFGGNVGHIFLKQVSVDEREGLKQKLKQEVKKYPFARAYLKAELPPEWGYAHPSRVGDMVIVLGEGHAFHEAGKRPVVPMESVNGPKGMHGYEASKVKDMYGLLLLGRWPHLKRSQEMKGPVDSLQLHATVAYLLGIEPSKRAEGKPLPAIKDTRE